MPEWQDPSHSFQEYLDTAVDSLRARPCCHWRQLSVGRNPVQLLLGDFCRSSVWPRTGDP